MKTLSIHPLRYLRAHHPIEYLRVHFDYEGIWTSLRASLESVLRHVFALAKKIVVATMVLLTASFFVLIFIQLAEYYAVVARFYEAITSLVFPPLEPPPIWM